MVWKRKKIKVEPRILIENKDLSNLKNGDTENMLIHGDNLLGLKALEKDFCGKIKCIYIETTMLKMIQALPTEMTVFFMPKNRGVH